MAYTKLSQNGDCGAPTRAVLSGRAGRARTARWCIGWRASGLAAALLAVVVSGCGGDTAGATEPKLDAATGFWRLTLNHRAAVISTVTPYDTLRIVATPRNLLGATLTEDTQHPVTTIYEVADPSDTSVTVSATGLVRARFPHLGSVIRVRTTTRGVTRRDSVLLNVTTVAQLPTVDRIQLSVTPSDTLYVGEFRLAPMVSARALDPQGVPIPGVAFAFRSADTTLAFINARLGRVSHDVARYPSIFGRVMLYATATVYGVPWTDSIPIIVTPVRIATIYVRYRTSPDGHPVGYFSPEVITVGAGANVQWALGSNADTTTATRPAVDVVFDEPDKLALSTHLFARFCDPGGVGAIPPIGLDPTQPPCYTSIRWRSLPIPGTYHYRSLRYGTSGTIIVLP